MKKFFVLIPVLLMVVASAFIGCEKKQSVAPPASRPAVKPSPPPAAPAPVAPAPAPVPAKPAKK